MASEKQTIREELNEVEKEVSTLTFSISKAVPWSLIGVIVLQSMMLFFWAGQLEATFEAHVEIAKERFSSIQSQMDDRYRATRAQAEFALRDERIANNARTNQEIKDSLKRIEDNQEDKFNQLLREISTHALKNGVSP